MRLSLEALAEYWRWAKRSEFGIRIKISSPQRYFGNELYRARKGSGVTADEVSMAHMEGGEVWLVKKQKEGL